MLIKTLYMNNKYRWLELLWQAVVNISNRNRYISGSVHVADRSDHEQRNFNCFPLPGSWAWRPFLGRVWGETKSPTKLIQMWREIFLSLSVLEIFPEPFWSNTILTIVALLTQRIQRKEKTQRFLFLGLGPELGWTNHCRSVLVIANI